MDVRASAFLTAAALILLLPGDWLAAALLASVFHEAGHLGALYALGGRAYSITVGFTGAKIHGVLPGRRGELLCAAAGPAASLLLTAAGRFWPQLAVCGGVQGIFNLIPLYPMDGGRILRGTLQWLCPRQAERIMRIVRHLVLLAVFSLTLLFCCRSKSKIAPVLCCATALIRLLPVKMPCKSDGFAVQ